MECPVNGIFKLGQGWEKHIMGIFPARNSPYLFYRVEVRRVRRQLDKGYACMAEAISIVIKEGEAGIGKAQAIIKTLTDKYPLV